MLGTGPQHRQADRPQRHRRGRQRALRENLAGGSNTWWGNIILASGSSIGVGTGTTLTLATNVINGLAVGAIIGNTGLTKLGGGTLVLNLPNNAAGGTTVSAGVLNVQFGLALGLPTSAVTVSSGAS